VAVRPIVLYPEPVLLHPTRPVEAVDGGVRDLIQDLVETMHAAPGIGLAANQIGDDRRVCVVDLSVGEVAGDLKVFVNPRVASVEGAQTDEEGCLSFPDVTLEVERALRATVEALDAEGRPFTLTGEGLLARAMLHEIEHLDGHTFLRNVSPLKRQLVTRQIRKRMKAGDWVAAPAVR
jgi:peptide deformylase